MKKQLLSTSALVAAGMIASAGVPGTAQAQQTAQAPASSPITVQVGGYMRQFIGYSNQDDTGVSGTLTSTAKGRTVTMASDAEIYFSGKTTLSNGISVAMRVELEGNTSSDMIDESFATIEGAFGQIYMGSTDSAAAKLLVGAPSATPPIGLTTGTGNLAIDPMRTGGATGVLYGTGAAIQMRDDDSEKITYVTPRFSGFQAGISYTPELSQDRTGGGHVRLDSRVTYGRAIQIGTNFTRSFSGVDVALAASYVTMQRPENDGLQNFSQSLTEDPDGWAIGGQVAYAGFRVGAGYAEVNDQMAITGNPAGGTSATATLADLWNHGEVFEAGLTYTFGPAVVGVNYLNSKSKASTALSNDEKVTGYGLTGKYTLGPGVDVMGGILHYNLKGEGTTVINGQDTDNNKATAVYTGIALSF